MGMFGFITYCIILSCVFGACCTISENFGTKVYTSGTSNEVIGIHGGFNQVKILSSVKRGIGENSVLIVTPSVYPDIGTKESIEYKLFGSFFRPLRNMLNEGRFYFSSDTGSGSLLLSINANSSTEYKMKSVEGISYPPNEKLKILSSMVVDGSSTLFCGVNSHEITGFSKLVLIKVDNFLERAEIAKEIRMNYTFSPTDCEIHRFLDQSYIVIGYSTRNASRTMYAARFTPSFQLSWFLESTNIPSIESFVAIPTSKNHVIIFANLAGTSDVIFWKINSVGAILVSKRFNIGSGNRNLDVHSVLEEETTGKEGFVCVGHYQASSTTVGLVFKISHAGDVIWTRSVISKGTKLKGITSRTLGESYNLIGSLDAYDTESQKILYFSTSLDAEGCMTEPLTDISVSAFDLTEITFSELSDVVSVTDISVGCKNSTHSIVVNPQSSVSVSSVCFDCFGTSSLKDNVCSGYGTCVSSDSCSCYSPMYFGGSCNVTSCGPTATTRISSLNSSVCSSSGTCWPYDQCTCSNGKSGRLCQSPRKKKGGYIRNLFFGEEGQNPVIRDIIESKYHDAYFIVGRGSFWGPKSAFIARINSLTLEVDFVTEFGSGHHIYAEKIAEMDSEVIATIGSRITYSFGWFIAFSSTNGSLVCETYTGVRTQYVFFKDMVVSPHHGNDAFVTGYERRVNFNNKEVIVLRRFDRFCKCKSWSGLIGTTGTFHRAYGISLASNGDVIIVGQMGAPRTPSKISAGFIIRMRDGVIVWSKYFSRKDRYLQGTGRVTEEDANGNFFVVFRAH